MSTVVASVRLYTEPCDCGAKMRGRIVPEFGDARVAVERRLYDAALHAAPSAVNQSHFAKPSRRRGLDVLGHDRRDVGGREGVKIDLGLDGDAFQN